MIRSPSHIRKILPETVWREAMHTHEARLRPILGPYLERRGRGEKDPVLDFLFEYYTFRPSHLLRWTPGFGVALGGNAGAFLEQPGFVQTPAGVALDPAQFPKRRRASVRWIYDVLTATAQRPPFLGCHGLHEWAMVYRTADVRHAHLPLRLPPGEVAAVVEARPIACTHFDAFRFFTPDAQPLNLHQPTRAAMPTLEQPGCLHTNMDLYRWTYKLAPWTPGDLLADTFLLACRIREIDMRASPYDLRSRGLEPLPIETPEGRQAYQRHQQHFAREAEPLRKRLIEIYGQLLAHLS